MANKCGEMETVMDFIFLGSKITIVTAATKLKGEKKKLALWKKSYDKPRKRIKRQTHHFANKGPYRQSYSFSSSHV